MRVVQYKMGLRVSRYLGLPVIGALVYVLQVTVVPSLHPLLSQLTSGLVWLAGGITAVKISRPSPGRGPALAIASGILFMTVYMGLGGLLGGLGVNPMSLSPPIVAVNLAWVIMASFGLELYRGSLLALYKRRASIVLATTLLAVASTVPLSVISTLDGPGSLARLVGSRMLVAMSSLVAGIMNWVWGVGPALGFVISVRVTNTVSPILPDVSWLDSMMISTVAASVVYSVTAPMHGGGGKTVALGIVLLCVVWALQGGLGVYAVSVTSGSMRPTLDVGDLVILDTSKRATIEEGDVILFAYGGELVVHRVHSIESRGGKVLYVTKGDANSGVDPQPVPRERVVGVAVARVPWAGYPSLWIRSLFHSLGLMGGGFASVGDG